jgi:hypothetical protein
MEQSVFGGWAVIFFLVLDWLASQIFSVASDQTWSVQSLEVALAALPNTAGDISTHTALKAGE